MLWLSRKDSRASAEPPTHGAVVVRTPEDALRDTNVRVTYQAPHPPSPASPPLPPLPLTEPEDSDRDLPDKTPRRPHRVPRPPSPTPSASSLRPSLKSRSSTAVEDPPVVPPLPPNIPLSAPVPPFSPILLSLAPLRPLDPARTIVALETSTATYKSTLATLSSRPSYLADYLSAISEHRYSHVSSVYSTESSDDAVPSDSQGIPQTASTTLHIFLDRPSAPYAHILAFLRTPLVSPDHPSVLPPGIQLSFFSNSTSTTLFNTKLEALLEVRDESAYLGLDSLQKLCNEEIRQRLAHAPRHTRGTSHASVNTMMSPGLLPIIGGGVPPVHSLHASVHSLRTLTELVQGDQNPSSKDVLARVSGGSESPDEEGVEPLVISASPSPVPSPVPPSIPPRHHRDNCQATSKVSPHSASSSPGQTFTRPKLHKKSESATVVPTRPPIVPDLSRRSETKTGGRVAGHHHISSVGTGAVPPGWI